MAESATGISEPSSSYSLESSYYGPGSLICWYLTLASALITWNNPPRRHEAAGGPAVENRHNPPAPTTIKPTIDIILFQLYASLAAGHMVLQASQLDSSAQGDDVLGSLIGYGSSSEQVLMSLNASFRVSIVSVVVSGLCLWLLPEDSLVRGTPPTIGHRATANGTNMRARSGLYWVLLLPLVWTLCTLIYLTARFWEQGWILLAFLLAAFALLIGSIWVPLLLFVICGCAFCALNMTVEYYKTLRRLMSGGHYRSWSEAAEPMVLVLFLFPVTIAFCVGLCGSCIWLLPLVSELLVVQVYFPAVGVELGALDQLFPLMGGIAAFGFSLYKQFSIPRIEWQRLRYSLLSEGRGDI